MTRSDNMRRLWANPEWRARRVAAASVKASETQTRFWNDPTSRPARLAQPEPNPWPSIAALIRRGWHKVFG